MQLQAQHATSHNTVFIRAFRKRQHRSIVCVPNLVCTSLWLPGILCFWISTYLGAIHRNLLPIFTRHPLCTTRSCRTPGTAALYLLAKSIWRITFLRVSLYLESTMPSSSKVRKLLISAMLTCARDGSSKKRASCTCTTGA